MKILNSSVMFFTDVPFPPEESNDTAFKLCSTAEKAERFCPKRWRAIEQWFTETREVIKRKESYFFIKRVEEAAYVNFYLFCLLLRMVL